MTTAHKVTAGLAALLFLLLSILGIAFARSKISEARLDEQRKANMQREADLLNSNKLVQSAMQAQVSTIQAAAARVTTPTQIVKEVPTYITLPAAIHEVGAEQASKIAAVLPDSPVAAGDLVIPKESAKPFFDAQVQCAIDKKRLDACSQTQANNEALLVVKDKQIAEDKVALKGGSFWHRSKTALKWVGVGAAAGAVTTLVLHH